MVFIWCEQCFARRYIQKQFSFFSFEKIVFSKQMFLILSNRVLPNTSKRNQTIHFFFVCGRPIQPYRVIRVINGSMIRWIRRNTRIKIMKTWFNSKYDLKLETSHTNAVTTPIKFSFHSWLNSNLLSVCLHSYWIPQCLSLLFLFFMSA